MNQQPKVKATDNAVDMGRKDAKQSDYRSNTREDRMMVAETIRMKEVELAEPFTLRPTTMDDLEPAVDLFNICSTHVIGKNEVNVGDVRAEWLLPDFDVEDATRVVTDRDGQLVGYIEVWDINALPVDIWVWGRVHPDYEGLGIGSALMNWAEQRARQAVRRVPNDLRVAMRSGTFSGYGPAEDLLLDRGMNPIRRFYTMATELDRKPPEPNWPAGISVRPMMDRHELRNVVRAVRDAFRDHWGYVEQPFEEEYERWVHFMEHDELFEPDLWFLAMAGEEIAGMSLCLRQSREDKDMAWVRTLGVRRPWRRQGVGLALLHHSFGEFYRMGKARVGLGVDASSLTGATRLYERAGMRPIRQFDTYELVLRTGRDIRTQEVA